MGQLKLTRNSGTILMQTNPAAQLESQAPPFHQSGSAIHDDGSALAGRDLCEHGLKGKHLAQGRLDGSPGRAEGGHQSPGLEIIHTLPEEPQSIRLAALFS